MATVRMLVSHNKRERGAGEAAEEEAAQPGGEIFFNYICDSLVATWGQDSPQAGGAGGP